MPKILVADDNTNIQKMVSLAFSERGIEVIAVGNGEAAVRRLPELIPDLILADIFMPVRNGYEVCEYVKKDPRFSQIPVILLVGAFDPLDEKEAHRVGADGVLKKPFVPPDPLIAMVTSVLEKNPKLAAQLLPVKKAASEPKEAIHAQPDTVRARIKPENYAKAEGRSQARVAETQGHVAKTIPVEVPEEAAEYGFGSGRRTIDPAAVPSDAQAPVSGEGDEFDGASTSSDWRRSARDFDVPEDTAHGPAFPEHEMHSPEFSLGIQTPPQQSRIAEPTERIEPVAKMSAPQTIDVPAIEESQVFSVPEAPPEVETFQVNNAIAEFGRATEVDKAVGFADAAWKAESEPTEAPAFNSEAAAPEKEPEAEINRAPAFTADAHAQEAEKAPPIVHAAKVPEPEIEKAPEFPAAKQAPDTAFLETPLVKTETEASGSLTSKAAGWIESIFPAKYPKGGWFTSLTGSAQKTDQAEIPAPAEIPAATFEAEEEISATSSMEPPAGAIPGPSALSATSGDASSGTLLGTFPPQESAAATQATDEDSFFADESEVSGSEATFPAAKVEEIPPAEPSVGASQPMAAARDKADDQQASDQQSPSPTKHTLFADTDPALIEPPAVRVTPEPLLVNDELHEASTQYGGRPEQLPPVHSFLVPAAQPLEEHSADKGAPLGDQQVRHAEPRFEDDERIPTGPLPSREALSEIPFLSPPPEFHHVAVHSASAVDQEMVDAVVRKVLERIEPQLHELLSKDLLRPIVENILQNGNRKSDR